MCWSTFACCCRCCSSLSDTVVLLFSRGIKPQLDDTLGTTSPVMANDADDNDGTPT